MVKPVSRPQARAATPRSLLGEGHRRRA